MRAVPRARDFSCTRPGHPQTIHRRQFRPQSPRAPLGGGGSPRKLVHADGARLLSLITNDRDFLFHPFPQRSITASLSRTL
ncbi:MAG: hypothetical protein H7241_00225 [Novosphingobium sp.]|nr:hypothetical protein [Novosphingobium sp.]